MHYQLGRCATLACLQVDGGESLVVLCITRSRTCSASLQSDSELSTQSASELWSRSLEESAVLPDFTLTGPLELVLTEAQPISLYVPHQADAGLVRRILLRPGAALTIHKARSVALRRPLDLPLPPDSYVANVWGRAVRGTTPGTPDSLSGEHYYGMS